jgi:voltage-gated potassium channel
VKKRGLLSMPLDNLLRGPFIRLRLAVLLGLLLLMVGTGGYTVVEHYRPLDALYMTVITLSTVGYETVTPLSHAGKIFTIFLILGGIGTAAWVFTTIIEVFVSEQGLRIIGRHRMQRRVDMLSGHYIVCGFGRIGQQIAQMYRQDRVPHVVIEREDSRLAMLRADDVPHVEGDAADEGVLSSAGIARARALIAVTATDAGNTFIVLTARGLSPQLLIVARADSQQNEAKLRRAGATKVVSPHILGGRWMGITAVNPAVTEFITAMTEMDHSDFILHEFQIEDETVFLDQTFGAADLKRRTGALVVAIRQHSDEHRFTPNPPDHLRMQLGDILIAIGSPDQLNALARFVRPQHPESILPYARTPRAV